MRNHDSKLRQIFKDCLSCERKAISDELSLAIKQAIYWRLKSEFTNDTFPEQWLTVHEVISIINNAGGLQQNEELLDTNSLKFLNELLLPPKPAFFDQLCIEYAKKRLQVRLQDLEFR